MTDEESKFEAVLLYGSEPPAFSIGYERDTIAPSDSGFTVLFSDAPDPKDIDVADVLNNRELVGVGYRDLAELLKEHSEIAPGLDIAFEYGVADRNEDGEWVVGDLSRLERDSGQPR